MTVQEWKIDRWSVKRLCTDPSAPAVYVHGEGIEADGWTVISVGNADWNLDLTPWPEKAVFRGQPDFGGGAGEYLRVLTQRIIPAAEADIRPAARAVMGYSLAGLFAVYAALETDVFDAVASVSGSMWYPGFAEYARQKERAPKAAYFSVGEREKRSRNAHFRMIDECTESVRRSFELRGAHTAFELNSGGHFDDPEGRMRRALCWMKDAFDRQNGG